MRFHHRHVILFVSTLLNCLGAGTILAQEQLPPDTIRALNRRAQAAYEDRSPESLATAVRLWHRA
jgi:hypothetical protein